MQFRRRPLRGRILLPRLHPFRRKLRLAHRWMEAGRQAEAAQTFAELAEVALDHDRPIASQLFLQAGRASLSAGRADQARSLLLRGIRLMLEQGDPRLGPVSQRLTAELRSSGHSALAEAVEDLVPSPAGLTPSGSSTSLSPGLPAKCPYCGGNVHADQVDLADPDRPACAYCGSPLLGGERADG